jgi:hypothetical protein
MTGRRTTPVFFLLCAIGAVTAIGLAVREARSQDPVRAHVASTLRHGLTTDVAIDVTNRTATSRCVVLRVVARDRAGHDLAAAKTSPRRLDPHGHTRESAALQLTAKQYAEQLTLVRAVVLSCR